MKKIYMFGNPLVKEDSLPLKILPDLKKSFPEIEFEVVDPNENFPPANERDLTILDTVQGIKEPKLFGLNDLIKIQKSPNSPHDYDLGMHLLLLKKLKRIDSVRIIGIPPNFNKKIFITWLTNVIPHLMRNPG